MEEAEKGEMLLNRRLATSSTSTFPAPHVPLSAASRAAVAIILRVAATADATAAIDHVAFPHNLHSFRAWYESFPKSARPGMEVLFIRRRP